MAVVTISRQYGAGGLTVSTIVSQELGYPLIDRDIVQQAALRLGIDPAVAHSWDERAPAIVEEMGMALAAGAPLFGGGPLPQFDERAVDDHALADATSKVITSLADAGNYVILGRGAQAVLRDRTDAVHVSLVGALEDRVRRIMRSQASDEKQARARCDRVDGERAGYVKHYYGLNIRDPLLYHVVINTSRMTLEEAAAIVFDVTRRAFRPS
jgi:cytidylate kinase